MLCNNFPGESAVRSNIFPSLLLFCFLSRTFYLVFFSVLRRILQLATKREHENYMTMVFLCVINNQIHGVIEILRVCDRIYICEIKSIALHHNETVQTEPRNYYS